jgi:hypothetical protein
MLVVVVVVVWWLVILGIVIWGRVGCPPSVKALSAVLMTIPPVFDRVVASSRDKSCNLGPSLSLQSHLGLDVMPLLWCDGGVVECRLQVLVKPFPALLCGTRAQSLSDPDPVDAALLRHEL